MTPASSAPVIELLGLTVRFGSRQILHGLNVSLSSRMVGLLGPNGAGKSTLIQSLLGFCPIASGTARVLGHDISRERRQVRALVGYMPENDALIANMSAVSFVRMMGELSGLPPSSALERAHEVLFLVGLGEARYRMLGTYSLGMKQLAKLAQAIVHGPKLLILDEPSNGLDPPGRHRMMRLIHDMKDSGQMNLLLCSHLLRDVEETCDEVLILKGGSIVHHADVEQERRADVRLVEFETADASPVLADDLRRLGCDCAAVSPGRFRMTLPPGFELQDIYRLAAQRDVPLRRLSYRRNTLEDVFLKAVEG